MEEGGHGNMSPGQLSQVAGGRPLAHSVSGQLVHDVGHRWTSENIALVSKDNWRSLLVSISTVRWALDDIVYFTHMVYDSSSVYPLPAYHVFNHEM